MKRMLMILFTFVLVISLSAEELTEIKSSQVPKKAMDYLKKNLVSYTILRCVKGTEKGVTIKYAVQAESNGRKTIYVFDKDGNFIDRAKNYKDAESIKVPAPSKPAGTTGPSSKKAEPPKTEPVKK